MNLAAYTTIGLPVALATIMLSMGLVLHAQHFLAVFSRPRAVWVGLLGQMVGVPLLALLVVVATGMSGALAVGLMVLSFSPGGTTSNLFTQLAKGDLPLSISLTTIAGVITPFTLPVFTALVLKWQFESEEQLAFPVGLTILRLLLVMLLPLFIGMLCHRYFPAFAARLLAFVRPVAISLFAAVIAAIVIQNWEHFAQWFSETGVAVILLMCMALGLGWGLACLAGLEGSQRKSISIEVGMQNGGTALLVTQGVLHNSHMSSVPLLYGLLMLLPVLGVVWMGRREAA